MRTKQMFVSLLLLFTLGLAVIPANGAASTGAAMELASGSYLENSPVTIRVYDVVTAGSTFTVWFSYDLAGVDTLETNADYANITVTLGTNDDEWIYTMIFEAPTAGAYMGVHATGAATGTTVDLAADYIYAQSFARIWPQDLIIEIGISLMVVLIIVGVVVGLAFVGAKKLRG